MTVEVPKPLLSVIVPITKMAGKLNILSSWITKSINSSIQIIIVHDVADLATGQELKKLVSENKFLNIVLIEDEYGSPGYARNAGLEVATGEWYVFWDSDDKPLISNVLLALKESCITDEIIIGKYNIRNCLDGSMRENYTKVASFKSVAMNPGVWRMIFRSEIINDFRFTNLLSGEDQVFLSQINFAERNCKYNQKVFYEYSTGQVSQLTNSFQSLNDLPHASRLILKNVIRGSRKSQIFDLIMIIRQQITLIRRGNIRLRLQVMYFTIKLVKDLKFSMLLPIINALFFVMANLRKSRLT